MDSDEDDRRRDKFARERDRDDRRDNGLKRSGGRRDDYTSAKRSRNNDYESNRDDGNILMTFKKFLLTQDDDISDENAITKYNEYKINFKRQQLQKFFNEHKEEEWFRNKYHPHEVAKLEAIHLENVQKRLLIFNELNEKGTFSSINLDLDRAKDIIRVMDTVVVKLEDGTDEDIEALKSEKIEDESIEEPEKSEEEKNGDTAENGEKRTQLHKTQSVFLRNVPPTATTEEIEEICARCPGFLRLAFAEAVPERKWWRRAWATFIRDVNIKEICWNINAVKVKDTEFNAIINRDLTRRIRTTNGVTAHKQVAQNDLRVAAKLAASFDKKLGLFGNSEQSKDERIKDIQLGVDLVGQSKNPIIRQAKTVLMDIDADEISPEEEELLRRSAKHSNGFAEEKVAFQRDENILKALDMLIWYLRIVHSIDFYGHLDYPNEDKMPSRCGILHVRGQTPNSTQLGTNEEGRVYLASSFISDFTTGFNKRLEEDVAVILLVNDDEIEKLGKKSAEQSVEEFIQKNTVELSKDKWLCPLSGKKFKGPEFIRKHLMSKHEDAINDAMKESDFYNNYLADPKRPIDPEVKSTPTSLPREEDRRNDRYDRTTSRYSGGGGGDYRSNRPSGGDRYFDRRDNRQQISYRDLDAPEEIA